MTDPKLFAVALADPGALPSRQAHPFVAVLCGSLRAGDEVEIVRGGEIVRLAEVKSVPGRMLGARDPDGQITFADLDREDLSPGDTIRAPGLSVPPLSLSGPSELTRVALLHTVKTARKRGFFTPSAVLVRHLPDEAVVLFLEKAVRDALRPPKSAHNIRTGFEKAAHLYDAIERTEDGDRLRLAASALLEGRPLGWDLMSLASAALGGTIAEQAVQASRETLAALSRTCAEKLGRLADADRDELRAEGEAIRHHLQQQERAVALGWCSRCKDVVHLSPTLRCRKGQHPIKDCTVVVPSEVAQTRQALGWRHQ